jgi:iron-sulfur cluster repair protein YtfE (RIC family)
MNAIELLKNDHDRVEELMQQLDAARERPGPKSEEIFRELRQELTVHEVIEEEIFYPALKAHPKAKEVVLEAFEEHSVVDRFLGQLSDLDSNAETWSAKCQVMIENVRHHIEEEEEEMFKVARQVFEKDELEYLGERMQHRKDEAMAESGEAATGARDSR